MPKLGGFKNIFREDYSEVNVGRLNLFDQGTLVDPKALRERGLAHSNRVRVKILGEGELKKALTVKAHSFSKTAKEKIEKAGGEVEVI